MVIISSGAGDKLRPAAPPLAEELLAIDLGPNTYYARASRCVATEGGQKLGEIIFGSRGSGKSARLGSQGGFLTELFENRYRFTAITASREINPMVLYGTKRFIAPRRRSARSAQWTGGIGDLHRGCDDPGIVFRAVARVLPAPACGPALRSEVDSRARSRKEMV